MDVYSYENLTNTTLSIGGYTIMPYGEYVSNGTTIAALDAENGGRVQKYLNGVLVPATAGGIPVVWTDATRSALVGAGNVPSPVSGARIPLVTSPVLVAHRGNRRVDPENTMSAFRKAYAMGVRYIEMDLHGFDGGGCGVIHDSTVDALTDGTGSTQTFTPTTFTALAVDVYSKNVSVMPGYLVDRPPLFSEVLDWAADKDVVLVVEAKNNKAAHAGAGELRQRNWPTSKLIWQTGSSVDVVPLVASGYPVLWLQASLAGVNWATIYGYGARHVASVTTQWTAPLVAAAKGAGLTTWAYTAVRRTEVAAMAALGIEYVIGDDVGYLSQQIRRTRSAYEMGRYDIGMLGAANGSEPVPDDSTRGLWNSAAEWGYGLGAGYLSCLQGWACPIKGDANAASFTLSIDFNFDAVSADDRWIGVHVCASTDGPFVDGANILNGYHLLIRRNGTVQVYVTPAGSAATKIAEDATGTLLALGTTYTATITVTPTTVSVSCNGKTATATDASYRGGYFHLGRNGCGARFKSVTVS